MYRFVVGAVIILTFAGVSLAAFGAEDIIKPAFPWISTAPVESVAFLAKGSASSEIRLSSASTNGLYHLLLPNLQRKVNTSSSGKSSISELKELLNEPLEPTGVKAFLFEPEGLPPTFSNSCNCSSFSFFQFAQIYLDKYVFSQSIQKIIPKLPDLKF